MPRTLASITLSHSSSGCSWMKPGLLTPEATTSWSTRPNLTSAVSSIASASAGVSGRRTMVAGSPPTSRTSSATASSSALEPDASSTLPPSALSAIAVARPNVPDAPVMMATLPLTSNRDSGLRSGSEIIYRSTPPISASSCPGLNRASRLGCHDGANLSEMAGTSPAMTSPSTSSSGLEAKGLLGIEHRDDAQRAALAVGPAPREGKEGAALAGDLVDVAADVLDPGDAVGHHDLVRRLPVGEIVDDVAPGLGEIFVVEVRLRRPRPVRPEERAQRMVERLHVDADQLDLPLHQPFGGLLVEAGGVGEVVRVVAVLEMAPGIDHHDVVLADLRLGLVQVRGRDHAPLALGDRHGDAGAEKTPQRIAGDRRRVLGHVNGRIHVRAAMHDAFELLHQQAVLGVEFEHADVEVGARGPLRHAVPPAMAQVEELQVVGRAGHRLLTADFLTLRGRRLER